MLKTRFALVFVGVSVLALHCSSEDDRAPRRLTIYKVFTDAAGAAGEVQDNTGGSLNDLSGGAAGMTAAAGLSGGGAGAGGSPGVAGGQASGGVATGGVSSGGSASGGSGGLSTGGSGGRNTGATGGRNTGATGGTNSGGSGGGGNPYETCVAACQQTYCDPERAACANATGTAAAGPAKNQAKKDLCGAMIQCAETTKCYLGSIGSGENCYCGTADTTGCISGAADGLCKSQSENAAESVNGLVVGQRWVNPGYAVGLGGRFIRCTLAAPAACATQCGSSGSGGSNGTGGQSSGGSGGAESGGTGGVPATGGTTGSTGGDGSGGAAPIGGSDAGGGSGGTGGSTSGSGGSGGGSGTPARTCVGPMSCYVDLNTNGTSDCSESWVKNAQFLTNIDGWSPGFLAAGAWSASGPNSCGGSLASTVKTGLQEGGVSQCVQVAAGETYRIRTQYFVDASLSSTSASLSVAAYSNPDCSTVGPSLQAWNVVGSARGTWTETGKDSMLMPATTQSLRISLNATRNAASDPDATVLWDNVLFLQQ